MTETLAQVESCEELAQRCQEGDTHAFADLLDRLGPRVHGFLCKMVGNTHDAEDLTQEVFVKAYRNIDKFDTSRPFSPWLFTIARRSAATFFRRKRPVISLETEPASDSPDPQKQAESVDDCQRIWAFARALKPRHFQVLWLRYREDFSLPEIAQALGTTQINTKVLLHRARSDLAARLEASGIRTI